MLVVGHCDACIFHLNDIIFIDAAMSDETFFEKRMLKKLMIFTVKQFTPSSLSPSSILLIGKHKRAAHKSHSYLSSVAVDIHFRRRSARVHHPRQWNRSVASLLAPIGLCKYRFIFSRFFRIPSSCRCLSRAAQVII